MSEKEHELKDCFLEVHGKLNSLPDQFCYWKKESIDGRKIPKSLQTDYRPMFNYITNHILKNNLAELRLCLDYHRSIFVFLKPGLTFGWQHKLVICQLVASIYEGMFLDLLEYKISINNDPLLKAIGKDKIDNRGLGLGQLLDIFHKAGLFKNKEFKKYLDDINHLRNTIHPKSLNNVNASFLNNEVLKEPIESIFKKLDNFIILFQKVY